MEHAKVRLTAVDEPIAGASILAPDFEPGFSGDEAEDLLCGSCGARISRGVSATTLAERFSAPIQLLVKCPVCGKHNILAGPIIH